MSTPSFLDLLNQLVCEVARENVATLWLSIEERERNQCVEDIRNSMRIHANFPDAAEQLQQRREDREAKVASRKDELSKLSDARNNAAQRLLDSLSSLVVTSSDSVKAELTQTQQQLHQNICEIGNLNTQVKELHETLAVRPSPSLSESNSNASRRPDPESNTQVLVVAVQKTRNALAKVEADTEATRVYLENMINAAAHREVEIQRHDSAIAELLANKDHTSQATVDTRTTEMEVRLGNIENSVISMQGEITTNRTALTDTSARVQNVEADIHEVKSELTTTSTTVSDMEKNVQDCHDILELHLDTLHSLQETAKSQVTTDQVDKILQEAAQTFSKQPVTLPLEAEKRMIKLEGEILAQETELQRLKTQLQAYRTLAAQGNSNGTLPVGATPETRRTGEAERGSSYAGSPPVHHFCLPMERPSPSSHRSTFVMEASPRVTESNELPSGHSLQNGSCPPELHLRKQKSITPQPFIKPDGPRSNPRSLSTPFGRHPPFERVSASPAPTRLSNTCTTQTTPPQHNTLPSLRALFPPNWSNSAKNLRTSDWTSIIGMAEFSKESYDAEEHQGPVMDSELASQAPSSHDAQNLNSKPAQDTILPNTGLAGTPAFTKTASVENSPTMALESSPKPSNTKQIFLDSSDEDMPLAAQQMLQQAIAEVSSDTSTVHEPGATSSKKKKLPTTPRKKRRVDNQAAAKLSNLSQSWVHSSDEDDDLPLTNSAKLTGNAADILREYLSSGPDTKPARKRKKANGSGTTPKKDKTDTVSDKSITTNGNETAIDGREVGTKGSKTISKTASTKAGTSNDSANQRSEDTITVHVPIVMAKKTSERADKAASKVQQQQQQQKQKKKPDGDMRQARTENVNGKEKQKAKSKPNELPKPKPEPQPEPTFEFAAWPSSSLNNPIELD